MQTKQVVLAGMAMLAAAAVAIAGTNASGWHHQRQGDV